MSINVEGQDCPVCKGHLFNDDDVVFCPVCGAPHHRDCYASIGHCALEEYHGTDKEYKKPETQDESDSQNSGGVKKCPHCGEEISENAIFCIKCGRDVNAPVYSGSEHSGNTFGGQTANPFVIDPLGGVKQDELIDDIPATDIARFVVINTPRYVPKFKSLGKNGKSSWNWAAFLFPEAWLFYRKCYKQGLIFLMLSIIAAVLSIPAQIWTDGILMMAPKDANMQQVYTLLFSHMDSLTPFIQITSVISWVISLGYRIICGIFGDYFYKNNAVSKIKSIRTEENYSELLPRVGGVNLVMMLVAIFASNWIPMAVSLLI